MTRGITIGKLAKANNLSSEALRYYEREGLLAPEAVSESGYRLYSPEAIRRLRFIRHAKECGFTLGEIRQLLELRRTESASCSDVRERAISKKDQLASKIRTLEAMSAALDRLITQCIDDTLPIEVCPILSALEAVDQTSEWGP
jgi:MerR family Zn(II)-responsive transcriptional regulator of zntA